MGTQNTAKKRRLSPEEMLRKKNAINEIRHLMLRCYPDTSSKRGRNQILARVSDIFVSEFGDQKDEIRNQIIGRLFNSKKSEKLTLNVNGVQTEFQILKYAKLRKVGGVPVDKVKKSELPKYFREGVMAALFKKEIERRVKVKAFCERSVIDVTPERQKLFQKSLPLLLRCGWLRKFKPFRIILQN